MIETSIRSDLLAALSCAHDRSACRGNISHQALQLAAVGSGDYLKAICAAIMTLGGVHAPLLQTYALLALPEPHLEAEAMLGAKQRVPGWGNAFVKDGPDPLWQHVHNMLPASHAAKIDAVTQVLHAHGKKIYPNPSCYTASVALLTGMPMEITPFLLVEGRLSAWTQEYVRMRGLR